MRLELANTCQELKGVQSSGLRRSELAGAGPAADDAGGTRPWRPLVPHPCPAGLGRAPYLGCSQAGCAMSPTGRRRQALRRRPERSTRPVAREGQPRGRARKGGASPRSAFTKKKKRSCNGHELPTTKFPKCLTNGRPRRGTSARLPRRGRNTPHTPAFLARSLSSLQGVLISGLKFCCSLVEIKGPSLNFPGLQKRAITPSQSFSGCVGPRWASLL